MKVRKNILIVFLFTLVAQLYPQGKRINYPPPSPENLPPQVDFSWKNMCLGDTTCFINQTIRGNTYTWTISQMITTGHPHTVTLFTSSDTNICFYFPAAGTYSVSLHAYNNHDVTLTKTITVDSITEADFSFIHCSNAFINVSHCASSCYWDFGDGTHSILPFPIHQYADTGNYTVKLIVYKGTISDTMVKQIYVDVKSFITGAFTSTVSHDTAFVHATFNGAGSNYYWTWGDGTYSGGHDTIHVYKDSTAGYNVQLYAINLCGPATGFDSVKIVQSKPPPLIEFSWNNLCLGDLTCFSNQSFGANTYTWTVTQTVASPTTHIVTLYSSTNTNICFSFPGAGTYSVSLTGNNQYDVTNVKTIIIDTVTEADFSFIQCSNAFINMSRCASSYYWDFGDGTNSTLDLPVHVFPDTGKYNVTLVVFKGAISDTLKKQVHINVKAFMSGSFTSSISHDTVFVHAAYNGTEGNYYWAWGDGTHSTGHDTMHVYGDSTATWKVKLLASNFCGTATGSDSVKIIIPKPPSGLNFTNNLLSIVPNPVTNDSYIEAFFNSFNSADYLVQVYNTLGQTLFEEYFNFQPGINGFKISTNGLSTGVYIIVLQSGNSYIRQRFYVFNHP